MMQDNAVRQVDNAHGHEHCLSDNWSVFFSLFHRLCYENNSRNIS